VETVPSIEGRTGEDVLETWTRGARRRWWPGLHIYGGSYYRIRISAELRHVESGTGGDLGGGGGQRLAENEIKNL